MHILFVCTGNTCRSPLAEALAARIIRERSLSDIDVASAGTNAADGSSASDGALLVGLEHDLDLGRHRARLLTRDLVLDADLILAMGPLHLERIEALGGEKKAHLLTAYASHGATQSTISDPFGGDLDVYRATVAELKEQLARVFDRVHAARGSGAS